MAKESAISWTRSTFNPWVGCTKVGPGCDHCYAEALDKRHRWGGDTHWGDAKPRHRTSVHNWNNPTRWNKLAEEEKRTGIVKKSNWHTPGFWPVFCASLADVFDNKIPEAWRADLWKIVEATPHLSWLLVTKRIGNVERMTPREWLVAGFPAHVRILITVVDQIEADRDIPKLLALPVKNGISYEPALGAVDWSPWLMNESWQHAADYGRGIEWLIVGGESTQGGGTARPFDVTWARNAIHQCREAGVPVFVKQVGSNPIYSLWSAAKVHDRAGAEPKEWPSDIRIQEFPK